MADQSSTSDPNQRQNFSVHQLVSVAPRTGPGENNPGGIAKIICCHPDGGCYDIKYVLDGRTETNVDSTLLQPHSFALRATRRKAVLGRCQRCGSLRKDCGSCDWVLPTKQTSLLLVEEERKDVESSSDDGSGSTESDSSIDMKAIRRRNRIAFARYKKEQQTALALLATNPMEPPNGKEDQSEPPKSVQVPRRKKPRYQSVDGGVLAAVTAATTTGFQLANQHADDSQVSSSSSDEKEGDGNDDLKMMPSPSETIAPGGYDDGLQQETFDHSQDDYLGDNDVLEYAYSAADNDQYFIQPEGSAHRLPRDVADATAHLSKRELIPFLISSMDRIEEQIADFRQRLDDVAENASAEASKSLHDEMVQVLVREGLDQCNSAMRRVRKDVVALRLDGVSMSVQGIIARARTLARSVDEDDSSDSFSQSGSWADPTDAPSPVPIGTNSPARDQSPAKTLDEIQMDPHPFATRKRRTPGKLPSEKGKKSRSKRPKRVKRFPNQHTIHLDANRNTPFGIASQSLNDDTLLSPRNNRHARKRSKRVHPKTLNSDDEVHVDESIDLPNSDSELCSGGRTGEKMRRKVKPRRERERIVAGNITNFPSRRNRRRDGPRIKSTSLATNRFTFDDVLTLPQGSSQTGGQSDDSTSVLLRDHTQDLEVEPRSAVLLFGLLREKLLDGGPRTLQDYISVNSPKLKEAVSVLVRLVKLLGIGANKELSPADDVVYRIFGENSGAHFLDSVMLQLVDSVMALMHPSAWALNVPNPLSILRTLERLRSALQDHFFVLERASRCISHELAVQEWRCVRDGDGLYISSVDPRTWCQLVETGNAVSTKPSQTRLASFVDLLPRCEVDCLWKALAFFAGKEVDALEIETKLKSCRWQLLKHLICKSSLLDQSGKGVPLTPSGQQVEAAKLDISRVSELVGTGRLGDLPRRDTFVFDLIHRAIALQADAVSGDESPAYYELDVSNEKEERLFIDTLMTDGFALSFGEAASTSSLCVGKVFDAKWMGQPLLLPSSKLLRACLQLFYLWRARMSSCNPKRLESFGKSVKALISDLSRSSPTGVNPTSGDTFLSAFSSDESPISRRDNFKLESATFVSIFSVLNLSEGISHAKHIWNVVCDTAMEQRRSWIENDDDNSQKPNGLCPNPVRLQIAAKAMTHMFLLPTKALQHSEGVSSSRVGLKFFEYCSSCLVACLDYAMDGMSCVRTVSMLLCQLSIMGSALRYLTRHEKNGHSRTSFSLNLWKMIRKSAVFSRSFSLIVGCESCGSGEDLCLQALLSAIVQLASLFPDQPASGSTAHLYDILNRALCESEPSNRYSLQQKSSLTSQGMCLVGKHHSMITVCLSHLVDPFLQKSAIKKWVSGLHRPGSWGQDDYRKRVGSGFVVALCQLYVSKPVLLQIFDESKSELLLSFLTHVFDVSKLIKVPSCNLSRIGFRSGLDAEEKSFNKLVAYSNGKSKAAAAFREHRSFARQVGKIFKDLEEGDVFSAILSYGNNVGITQLAPSLERESFELVRLFVGVLGALDTNRLDSLLNKLLHSLCCNMLDTIVSSRICARSLENVEKSYQDSVSFEFFSCYCEVFIGTLAAAFHFAANATLSNSVRDFLALIAQRFLCPVLRQREIDLSACLVSVVNFVQERDEEIGGRFEADEEALSAIVRQTIVRRFRFFLRGVLSISQVGETNLLESFFARVGNSADYEDVICTFAGTPFQKKPTSGRAMALSHCIDGLFEGIDKDYSCPRAIIEQNIALQRRSVGKLIPTLRFHSRKPMQVLGTISALIDLATKEKHYVAGVYLTLQSKCLLVRGLWITACSAVSSASAVDGRLLIECFRCLRSVARLPSNTTTLVDNMRGADREDSNYLSCAMKFLKAFGAILVSSDRSRLSELRLILASNRGTVVWPPLVLKDDEVTASKMADLETKLFPVEVRNPYSAQKQANTDGLLQSWRPSLELQAAVEKVHC